MAQKQHDPTFHLVDTHGHYVFGVDDGAADLEMSVSMVRMAHDQGIRQIICTTHSWGRWKAYPQHLAALQNKLRQENIPVRLHPGTEIACCEAMLDGIMEELRAERIRPLGKSRYILLEFDPDVAGQEILTCVRRFRETTRYRPVIAHAERYRNLAEDSKALQTLSRWSIPFQINAYSLVEESNSQIRDFARRLLAEKRVTFIGSDAHRLTHRPPNVASGIAYIYETCDKGYANDICYRNAQRMLLRKFLPFIR